MRVKDIARALLAAVLLVSYCGTIPVLSVVHWHAMVPAARPGGITSHTPGRDSEDPLFPCGVCARLASSPSFFTHTTLFLAVRPVCEISLQSCSADHTLRSFTSTLDRAPPPDRTVC